MSRRRAMIPVFLAAMSAACGGCADLFQKKQQQSAIISTPQPVVEPAEPANKPKWNNPFRKADTEDATPKKQKNIVAVRTFGFKEPWVSFDAAGDRNAEGFKMTVVLESGDAPIGVYGDGTLTIKMYRITPGARGGRARELACEWSFTPEEAMPFLSRKRRDWGWGYGLRLNWGDTDVYGQEIEVVAAFTLMDGRVLAGTPLSMKVPKRVEEERVAEPAGAMPTKRHAPKAAANR